MSVLQLASQSKSGKEKDVAAGASSIDGIILVIPSHKIKLVRTYPGTAGAISDFPTALVPGGMGSSLSRRVFSLDIILLEVMLH